MTRIAWEHDAVLCAATRLVFGLSSEVRSSSQPAFRARNALALLALSAALVWLVPAATAHAASPHIAYRADTRACAECHAPHEATSSRYLFTDRAVGEDGITATQVTLCYTCHDGTAGANVKTGGASFAGASGHAMEQVGADGGDADLTDVCSSCHYPHANWVTLPRLPLRTINGKSVTGADISWCVACHDDDQSWYVSVDPGTRTREGYEALVPAPARDATGYPVLGTFPGATVYLGGGLADSDPARNAHLDIPAGSMPDAAVPSRDATRVAGDCLWCHAGHRGRSEYDGLVSTFSASSAEASDTIDGDYAGVCFTCHAPDGLVPAPDIKTLATGDPVDSGHTIRSADATYPAGAPLPCYECHNPHGSTRGNAANISDSLGQNLDPRDPREAGNVGASEEKVRQFCFSCHVTHDSDGVTGRPWAWDSTAGGVGAYVPVPVGASAIGLSRNVAVGVNDLRLPLATGHNVGDVDRSCYECHGDVHRPMSGTSEGGVACSVCHSALNGMAHTPPDYVGDTTTYHHVLDDPAWDQAPEDGPYPTSRQDLSCVSCHVDHSEYKPLTQGGIGKGYSLRDSALTLYPEASNTDDTLCLSCHTVELDRNSTGQKANAITETKVWKIDETMWAESPHNYDSPGPFNDGSNFYANCAKCHGNLQGTLSSGKFSVHFSAEQRLLNALGDTSAVTLAVNEEQMCFRCHSKVGDFVANGGTLPGIPKPSTPDPSISGALYWDWYGTQEMSASNASIYGQMTSAANTFGHKTHAYTNKHLLSETDETQAYLSANKHVECADCHNHHVVGDARHDWGSTNLVSQAIRGVTGQGFKTGTGFGLDALWIVNFPTAAQVNAQIEWKGESKGYATYEYEICLKCHSTANSLLGVSQLPVWGGTKTGSTGVTADRWTNVAADFNVGNQSRHPVIAPNDAYADTGTYGTSKVTAGQLNASIWAPGDTMYCSDCHGNQNAPLPTDPTAIDYTQGPHGSSVEYSLRGPNTLWPKDASGVLWNLNSASAASTDATPNNEPFCANCHTNIKGNIVHQRNALHKSSPCVMCHTLIPHGGGMSRLIADADSSMPARYAYNNQKSFVGVSSFTKRAATAYTTADCSISPAGVAAGCTGGGGKHQLTGNRTGANGTGTWENW